MTGGTDSDDVSFGSTVTATSDSLDINVASSGDVTLGDGTGTDTVYGINALTTNANVITVNTAVSATSIVLEGANTSGDQLTLASREVTCLRWINHYWSSQRYHRNRSG